MSLEVRVELGIGAATENDLHKDFQADPSVARHDVEDALRSSRLASHASQ